MKHSKRLVLSAIEFAILYWPQFKKIKYDCHLKWCVALFERCKKKYILNSHIKCMCVCVCTRYVQGVLKSYQSDPLKKWSKIRFKNFLAAHCVCVCVCGGGDEKFSPNLLIKWPKIRYTFLKGFLVRLRTFQYTFAHMCAHIH